MVLAEPCEFPITLQSPPLQLRLVRFFRGPNGTSSRVAGKVKEDNMAQDQERIRT